MRYWTTHEILKLRELYPDTETAAIGKALGRTELAVGLMAFKLGLRKSPAFMAAHCRYQHGHATWNAGMNWNPPGSRATQFKKGQRNIRYRPVGVERMERGRLMVKVAEPNVWKAKARIVWEENFGPIPAGMIVRLKDADIANCAPGNLTLITRAENARLNCRIRKPKRKRIVHWVKPLRINA
jgi:hypothetical protein